jgi:hypothetical protein
LLRGIFFSLSGLKFGALNLLRMIHSESQVDSTMPAIHGTGGILCATFWANNGIHFRILFLAAGMATMQPNVCFTWRVATPGQVEAKVRRSFSDIDTLLPQH